eukprot:3126325-Karenia_brevis.AAC.1
MDSHKVIGMEIWKLQIFFALLVRNCVLFFLDERFQSTGNASQARDWFSTPKCAHMRPSDPCLLNMEERNGV